MAIKAMKMGEKARRNEKGYYLEKLWIGSREGKNALSSTQWLHKKEPEKHRELTWVYIGLINAVDTGGGCESGMRPKDQDSG
jgi:hypothetical protein